MLEMLANLRVVPLVALHEGALVADGEADAVDVPSNRIFEGTEVLNDTLDPTLRVARDQNELTARQPGVQLTVEDGPGHVFERIVRVDETLGAFGQRLSHPFEGSF